MVNALKKNLSPLPASKYCKLTKHSTQRHYQVDKDNSGVEVEMIRVLGTLCSLRSKKKLAAEKPRQMHFLNIDERERERD
jgi:hypothetical protein